jgi:hypothetical protein
MQTGYQQPAFGHIGWGGPTDQRNQQHPDKVRAPDLSGKGNLVIIQ